MPEHARAPHHLQERPLSALDAIFMRRSVRAYAAQSLDEPTIRALLDAAVQAPTALHSEPWAFVVVQDRTTLKRISDRAKGSWGKEAAHYRDLHRGVDAALASTFAERVASPDFCVFYDAGTLIAIGARPLAPFVAADCWLAAENLMLAACALGLDTCCIGSAVPALNSPDTKSELGIPSDVEIIAPIIVGVSREPVAGVSRRNPTIVSWTRSQTE
jgi:nitroreductase